MKASVTAVVPTLGPSPGLLAALRSLRREGGNDLEIVVVHQGSSDLGEEARELTDRLISTPDRLGFAAANNRGLGGTTPWWLLLNDDAELLPGWLDRCRAHLEHNPRTAAVQGGNLKPSAGTAASKTVDGYGIAWSPGGWQALQVGRGEAPREPTGPREVFGVSATACLMRREALESVVLVPGEFFDHHLDTYYEDVDLAVRLRAAGWGADCLPEATALHLGGASARTLGRRRLAYLYGNRYLAVARLLGRDFPRERRSMVYRDLRDLARRPTRLAGILAGWRRASTLWSHFAHDQSPLVPRSELHRFGAPL